MPSRLNFDQIMDIAVMDEAKDPIQKVVKQSCKALSRFTGVYAKMFETAINNAVQRHLDGEPFDPEAVYSEYTKSLSDYSDSFRK